MHSTELKTILNNMWVNKALDNPTKNLNSATICSKCDPMVFRLTRLDEIVNGVLTEISGSETAGVSE